MQSVSHQPTPKHDLLTRFKLTLYHQFPSRSTRAQWVLNELQISSQVETKYMDLRQGEHLTREFRLLNPQAKIPILCIQDIESNHVVTMTESAAICTFLTDHISSPMLKPPSSNVFAVAQYHRFISMATSSIDPLLWDLRLHEQLLPKDKRIPAVAERARTEFLERIVPVLEAVLLDGSVWICHPYLQQFTTADVMIGYCCWWARMYKLLDRSPCLMAYIERIRDRDAFKELYNTPNAYL